MSIAHNEVRFYDVSFDGLFVDRIYASDLYDKNQVKARLIKKGFGPDIELSEAY